MSDIPLPPPFGPEAILTSAMNVLDEALKNLSDNNKVNMRILEACNMLLKEDIQYESKPIPETDQMGREKFWEDAGRPND
jgi:hypothetical protein